jgi:hypothetical protein
MKRLVLTFAAGAALALGSVSAAGATHTGCEHARTAQAHASVPHFDNHGTHTAHASIPYCPPEDAPRHG